MVHLDISFKNVPKIDNMKGLQSIIKEKQESLEKNVEIVSTKKLADEPSKNKSNNFLHKILGKVNSGSLTSSIFSLCILSLGTSSLALPQKIGYMSLFFSPIIIFLSGLINYWSLTVLSNASRKFKIKSYEGIVSLLFGKLLNIFLDIIICINQSGIITLYQVISYKLLRGFINEILGMGFPGVDEFAEKLVARIKESGIAVALCIAGGQITVFQGD